MFTAETGKLIDLIGGSILLFVTIVMTFVMLLDMPPPEDEEKNAEGEVQEKEESEEWEDDEEEESETESDHEEDQLRTVRHELEFAHKRIRFLEEKCAASEQKAELYKRELESVKKERAIAEENIREELNEIVIDLMVKEQEKRDKWQEEQDEEAFDKLNDLDLTLL